MVSEGFVTFMQASYDRCCEGRKLRVLRQGIDRQARSGIQFDLGIADGDGEAEVLDEVHAEEEGRFLLAAVGSTMPVPSSASN